VSAGRLLAGAWTSRRRAVRELRFSLLMDSAGRPEFMHRGKDSSESRSTSTCTRPPLRLALDPGDLRPAWRSVATAPRINRRPPHLVPDRIEAR
jgi:hypothetical protein